jgi:hypothetical protein
MPTESTVRSWAIDDIKEFSAHYTRARDIGIDCEVDLLMETARDINTPVDRARLIVDTIKWRVSKLAPKRYGDRLALSGPEGGPVEIKHTVVSDLSTETLLRIAEELEAKRAAQFPTVRVAELEVGKCRVSEE